MDLSLTSEIVNKDTGEQVQWSCRLGCGGSVVEHENLPDGVTVHRLGRMLDPSWGDAEAGSWLSHAASVTERTKRRQGPNAGFLGERDRARSPDGPNQVWIAHAAAVEAAKAAHRRLVAER